MNEFSFLDELASQKLLFSGMRGAKSVQMYSFVIPLIGGEIGLARLAYPVGLLCSVAPIPALTVPVTEVSAVMRQCGEA